MLNEASLALVVEVFGLEKAKNDCAHVYKEVKIILTTTKGRAISEITEHVADRLHRTLGPLGIFGASELYDVLCKIELCLRSQTAPVSSALSVQADLVLTKTMAATDRYFASET